MIHVDNLVKEVGVKTLFHIEHVTIAKNEKIALIGNNGVGKTSFLKILAGLDVAYSGYIKTDMAITYLLNDSYTKEYTEQSVDTIHRSPGEQQKVKLAQLLADNSAFALIDEPTSHLDIKQKRALVLRLQSRDTGFILVSHDRDLINRTCTKIFELIHETVEVYNGNYTFYLEEREKRSKFAHRAYASYAKEKKRLMRVANAIQQQSAKVKTTPKRMGNSEARLHKMGGQQNKKKLDKQVKATLAKIDQLEVKKKPYQDKPIKLSMDKREKIYASVLIQAQDLNKSYAEHEIFKDTHFLIPHEGKIALIGDNGSGKTTLLNMILQGEVYTHPNLRIGYYSQTEETLVLEKSVLDNIRATSIYDQTMTRIVLARLGFREHDVHKKVNVLSDGEKAKLKLAKLLTGNFNYLMLDEPTNFLDIHAIEALEGLLIGYDRPLIFVSHDVAFIENVADSLLVIKDKKLVAYEGKLSELDNAR